MPVLLEVLFIYRTYCLAVEDEEVLTVGVVRGIAPVEATRYDNVVVDDGVLVVKEAASMVYVDWYACVLQFLVFTSLHIHLAFIPCNLHVYSPLFSLDEGVAHVVQGETIDHDVDAAVRSPNPVNDLVRTIAAR